MNVVWIILDSLSFAETSLADGGSDTTPQLAALARERGTVFDRAYSPGPSSPSSHAALFTGHRPSQTGMHEAAPYYFSDLPTIAGALDDTHSSYLISTNPFLFNGLDEEFDETDSLSSQQYLVFEEATDPREFLDQTDYESTLKNGLRMVANDKKYFRSFVNAVSYKLWARNQSAAIPQSIAEDELDYQYATTTNNRIRDFLSHHSNDSLVVANYMDVHPPFDASDEALSRFAPGESREDLPIAISGQEVLDRVNEGDEETLEKMMKLYRATIWDADRKITPLVRELVDDGAFVAVTADHGNWFKRRKRFETHLIHVPLVLLGPGLEAERVSHTVNIRDLASTTLDILGQENVLDGTSLRNVTEDRTSITESIHKADSDSPVNAEGGPKNNASFDVAVLRDGSRVDCVDGEYDVVWEGDVDVQELRSTAQSVISEWLPSADGDNIEYDAETRNRLEDLGYL